jgi:hypothetical protein
MVRTTHGGKICQLVLAVDGAPLQSPQAAAPSPVHEKLDWFYPLLVQDHSTIGFVCHGTVRNVGQHDFVSTVAHVGGSNGTEFFWPIFVLWSARRTTRRQGQTRMRRKRSVGHFFFWA